VLGHVALVVAVVLLVILASRYSVVSRELARVRAARNVLAPGDAVPVLPVISSAGDSILLGHVGPGERQLLLFLAKECPFCRATLPAWREIGEYARDAANGPISVVAIALDSVEQMPAYLAAAGISAPAVALPGRRARKLFRAGAVPQTVVIGDSGIVLYARTGQIVDAAVRDSVIAALRASAPIASTATKIGLP